MKYICTKCWHEKDSTEFYPDKRNIFKGVIAQCKECRRTYRKEHPTAYTPQRRIYAKEWRDGNLEHCREVERAKRERNQESYRAAVRKWAKAHPEASGRNRALKRSRVPAWAERDKISEVYRKAVEWGFEVDHIVPLQHPLVCGLHVWPNLQLLDKFTNGSKQNREWPDMPEERI